MTVRNQDVVGTYLIGIYMLCQFIRSNKWIEEQFLAIDHHCKTGMPIVREIHIAPMWTKISVTTKLSKPSRGELFTISTLSGFRMQDAETGCQMQNTGCWTLDARYSRIGDYVKYPVTSNQHQ